MLVECQRALRGALCLSAAPRPRLAFTRRCSRHASARANNDTDTCIHSSVHSFIHSLSHAAARCSKIPRTCHFQSAYTSTSMLSAIAVLSVCSASAPADGVSSPSLQARQRIYAPMVHLDRLPHGMRRRPATRIVFASLAHWPASRHRTPMTLVTWTGPAKGRRAGEQ